MPPPPVLELLSVFEDRADEIAQKLGAYIGLLLRVNRSYNLTADRSPSDQWHRHVEDALRNGILLQAVLGAPEAATRILDVGSGGGVPGLVWAMLWPRAQVSLVEASEKKAAFLRLAIKELKLTGVQVHRLRAERLGLDPAHREAYDLVTARALASLPTLAEWTMPFAKIGGAVAAIKGAAAQEELRKSKRAFKLLGAPERPQALDYARSDGMQGKLFLFRKSFLTPSAYPRREGVAAKNPL